MKRVVGDEGTLISRLPCSLPALGYEGRLKYSSIQCMLQISNHKQTKEVCTKQCSTLSLLQKHRWKNVFWPLMLLDHCQQLGI